MHIVCYWVCVWCICSEAPFRYLCFRISAEFLSRYVWIPNPKTLHMIEKHQPLLSLPPTLGPGIINRESWRLDGNANTSGYLRLGISASGVGDRLGGGWRKIHLIRQRKGWHFVKLASSVTSSAPCGFYCHLWACDLQLCMILFLAQIEKVTQ